MGNLIEPLDLRKYFVTCVILAVVCLVAGLFAVASSGYASSLLETSIKGTGSMEVRHHGEGGADVAMAQNATVIYQSSIVGGAGTATRTFSSSFMVFGAGGTRRDQYVVRGSGAGDKVEFRATQIAGDFVGEGEIVLTIVADVETFESRIVLDSTGGVAAFQARVRSADPVGRPLNTEEIEAAGSFLIESYLLTEKRPETPDDWLQFCSTIEDEFRKKVPGAILDPEVSPV